MWDFFGYPKGSASELLDGTLKLCYCTGIFTVRFPPCSLPRVGNGEVKGMMLLLEILGVKEVTRVRGSS